jgi:hypothetical protein
MRSPRRKRGSVRFSEGVADGPSGVTTSQSSIRMTAVRTRGLDVGVRESRRTAGGQPTLPRSGEGDSAAQEGRARGAAREAEEVRPGDGRSGRGEADHRIERAAEQLTRDPGVMGVFFFRDRLLQAVGIRSRAAGKADGPADGRHQGRRDGPLRNRAAREDRGCRGRLRCAGEVRGQPEDQEERDVHTWGGRVAVRRRGLGKIVIVTV